MSTPDSAPTVLDEKFEAAIKHTFDYLSHRRAHADCNPDTCEEGAYLRSEALRARHNYRVELKTCFG